MQNIGLQMAKLHELEGQLLEERGDKAELMAEKEALIERLQRLNGMDKENLQEKESLQAALIQSEEDRLCIANSLVASQIDLNNCQMEAEKTKKGPSVVTIRQSYHCCRLVWTLRQRI